jgi:EmrB/QacA subfamily drug resistance transporter
MTSPRLQSESPKEDWANSPDPRRWRALALCLTATFVTVLDISLAIIAVPSIGTSTGAGPAQLQWVISGYALTFGLVPILAGRLGDDLGRKRILITGTMGFVATSALVGFAPTIEVLIAARFLQGAFGGVIGPQVLGLVQQLFPVHERGKAFSLVGVATGAGTALGPMIGGAIMALGGPQYGWRLAFLSYVPVGLVSIILCALWLPKDRRDGCRMRFDAVGILLMALAMLGILFPAVQFNAQHDGRLLLVLVPAVAFAVAFYLWEAGPARRRGFAFVDTRLFGLRSFLAGIGIAMLYFGGYLGVPLLLTLYLQHGVGFSPLAAGLTAGSFALGVAVSGPISGRMVNRFGRSLVISGLAVFAGGVIATATVAVCLPSTSSALATGVWLTAPLLIAGLGAGCVMYPNQAIALTEVPIRSASTAGGILQASQRMGGALGSALCGAVFYSVVTARGNTAESVGVHGYSLAYGAGAMVVVGFALSATVLAVMDLKRSSPAHTASVAAQIRKPS